MKKTLLTTALLVSSGLFASAVTTATVRNFTTLTNGLPILDNAGNPISGSYAVGFYADDFDFTQDAPAIRSGLTQFGNELNSFVFTGMVGAPNSTQGVIPKEGGSPFTGKNIFVLFGDQTSLDASTLFGVFKINGTFQNENAADLGVALADVVPGNGDLVYGNLIAPTSQPPQNPNLNFAQGIQLVGVAIPEPSTGLLSALAGLALVARRRR
jgi:hypothetical protein